MPKAKPLGKGWTPWTHKIGFSFKQGDIRADLWPAWRSWREPWIYEVWRGNDRANLLAEGSASHHWEGADRVHEAIKLIESGE